MPAIEEGGGGAAAVGEVGVVGADVFEGFNGREVGAGGAELLGEVLGAADGGEEGLNVRLLEPGHDVDGREGGIAEGFAEVGRGEAVGEVGVEEDGLFGGGEGGEGGWGDIGEHVGKVRVWVVLCKWDCWILFGIAGKDWGNGSCVHAHFRAPRRTHSPPPPVAILGGWH
jgi:hypothetical protein